MARALGMCPKCKGYWRIRDLMESKYSCLHCGYQLRVGSVVPVKSGKGRVLTPCTPDRANREVASHRAQFDAHGTLWLYDSPELHAPYRGQVFERDAGICLWCGNLADTVDHIIPYSEGGVYHPANLMCACRHCNQKRQNDDVPLFLERLAGESAPAPYAGYIVQLYDLACGLVLSSRRRSSLPRLVRLDPVAVTVWKVFNFKTERFSTRQESPCVIWDSASPPGRISSLRVHTQCASVIVFLGAKFLGSQESGGTT